MPLRRTPTIANLNASDDNPSSEPFRLSLPAADLPEKDQCKEGAISIPIHRLPFAVLKQPYTTVHPSIFKPPVMTTSLPRRSSLLGPCQYLLPARPIFPPSVRKQNLYRQVLKKSARQARHIRRMGKKKLGGLHRQNTLVCVAVVMVAYHRLINS
jgi:hypothetical protein